MKKGDVTLLVLVVLLVTTVFAWTYSYAVPSNVQLAPDTSVESRVNIGVRVNIAGTPDLIDGIDFGVVDPDSLPANDVEAVENTAGGSGETTIAVARQADTNTDIEICVSADGDLDETILGLSYIPLSGETYDFSTDPNAPSLPGTAMTTTPTLASGLMDEVTPLTYYRLWLDVPSDDPNNPGSPLPTGDYANTITFIAQEAGSGTLC